MRILVLGWSAALLTASYGGFLPKMDPTFIASIFTASLATFGVDAVKKDAPGSKSDNQPKVEPTPPSPPDKPSATGESEEQQSAPGSAAPVP